MSKYLPSLTFPEAIYFRPKFISFWASVLAVVELIHIVGFLNVDIGYGLTIPLTIIPVILWGSHCKITLSYLLFLTYIPLEILIASPSPVFKSWYRYFLFASVLIVVSPLIQNSRLRLFRFKCLKWFLIALIPLSVISFFCYFFGINFFVSSYDSLDYTVAVGRFGGLFKHSMILGPMCAISTCVSLWLVLRTKRLKNLFIALTVLSGGCTLFSASRAASLGAFIACILLLFFFSKEKSKGIKRLLVVAVLACVFFPLWESALHGITTKNESNIELGEYGSRTVKFYARFVEIRTSPIVGVGFASIDPKGFDHYNTKTGVVEPGSSWLGAFSMTGIIGFLFVASFFIKAYSILLRAKTQYSALMIALVSFFAFHLLFEGYIFAGGSVLCFIFWLTMGVAYDQIYAITKNPIESE